MARTESDSRPQRAGLWIAAIAVILALLAAVASIALSRTGNDSGTTGTSGATSQPSAPATTTPPPSAAPAEPATPARSLQDPVLRDVAMQLVSSAENSTLDWRGNYGYIENIDDGRGYTGGPIGFTTGTGDMAMVVHNYCEVRPSSPLCSYLSQLDALANSESDSTARLGAEYVKAWRNAAKDPKFRATQNQLIIAMYFNPAVKQAQRDGLQALGQFVYFDAMVMHGPGEDQASFGGIRAAAIRHAVPPSEGGDETSYLKAFLKARKLVMHQEEAHADTSRIDNAQLVFLRAGNLTLTTPLTWHVYGDPYKID